MDLLDSIDQHLAHTRYRWVVTGAAGFIGSHLVSALLQRGQEVISLDNLSRGHRATLVEVEAACGRAAARQHRLVIGDICDLNTCREVCRGAHFILHHAALGSVPGSIADPIAANAANVGGFVNMLVAARDAGARFIYAASSSTYGDEPSLPKVEPRIGRPLSPYAVTKYTNELYAEVFARCYGLQCVGFRYFNVFGPRQDPDGPYAAVIPRWIRSLVQNETVEIYGDGETTRDFCYVDNVVQANLLAALTERPDALNEVYNIAVGASTSLNELFTTLRDLLAGHGLRSASAQPRYAGFRAGDVRHSRADIGKARQLLGYRPSHTLHDGLRIALPWYVREYRASASMQSTLTTSA